MKDHPVLNFKALNPSAAELRAEGPKVDRRAEPVPATPDDRAAYWKGYAIAVVYFVQGAEGTPVKIGKAVDVPARIKTLQTGSFMPLRLLEVIPGGYSVESALHRSLIGDRMQGEWFMGPATDRLLREIPAFAFESCQHYRDHERILPIPRGLVPPETNSKRPLKVRYVKPTPVVPKPFGTGRVIQDDEWPRLDSTDAAA